MHKTGFDSEKYIEEQSKYILERINQGDSERLYLEFGGKLVHDKHAMRVLPGFDENAKIKLLEKMKDQAEDSHHWIVAGYQLGKVNRSRRDPKDDMDTVIDIGALRALRDHIADIDPEYVKEPITQQDHVDAIRKEAGKDKVPLLIIYRIDKDSRKRVNSKGRQNLDFGCDIIGIQICVPGDQINKDFCKKLTIQLPERDKEDEVEENE